MSTYDLLIAPCVCPTCNTHANFEIEAFFPSGNLERYKLGDKLSNLKKVKLAENFISEGYSECPYCGKDFFVTIEIRDRIIKRITVSDKKGYK
ncbi:hypothetical protein [Kalamiella sp. sgz302252]|uniref:hypothetical protein n=1 Tax=Pantoea sp. sgz302252 TaxID=3341827 RepID=UPI0036D24F92